MKLNFCTLFNSNYLSRGLVMYDSLKNHCLQFHLYIFTFDDKATEVLKALNLPDITVISLSEFEDEELLAIKPTRSAVEYCWTCTPSTILYCIKKFELDHCTYIDADLCFYSNPEVLIKEMGNNSVLIIDHRFTPSYDQSQTSGKYCVQFMCFKNTRVGLSVLHWWRNACNDWCYARAEDGKFGDQKYLDDWPIRFDGVHELAHIGGGVAPWNVQQYEFCEKGKSLFLKQGNIDFLPMIFYHFHGVKLYIENIAQYCPHMYELSRFVRRKIYHPYLTRLLDWKKRVDDLDSSFDSNGSSALDERLYSFGDTWKMYAKALLKLQLGKLSRIKREASRQKKLNYVRFSEMIF